MTPPRRTPSASATRDALHRFCRASRGLLAATAAAWWWVLPVAAADGAAGTSPVIFRDADLGLGARLLQEHRCSACHVRKVGGDGNGIYNPKGRISSPAALRGMVDLCSTELGLQLFPEEVTAVAAVLNRDHYRFVHR